MMIISSEFIDYSFLSTEKICLLQVDLNTRCIHGFESIKMIENSHESKANLLFFRQIFVYRIVSRRE
jgi:hypothetical protein